MSFISRLAWRLVGAAELPQSVTAHYWVKGEPVPDEDVPPHFWMVWMRCHYCSRSLQVYHHVSTGDVAYHYRAETCTRTRNQP
jgi:hypothetical protein